MLAVLVIVLMMSLLTFCLLLTQVAGNENPSILICFASKTTNAGQIMSKLHVIELGAQPGLPAYPCTFIMGLFFFFIY